MSYTIIRPKNRAEWLKQRENGIGSSEVGTILGLNPFETPYQLWRRKKGLDQPKTETFAMKAGHYLEDAVSLFYRDATGRQVIKSSEGDWLIVNNEHPYIRVSPDRTIWLGDKHTKENKGILECKTTQREIDPDDVPQHWFCQLQYQLGVAEMQEGALAWLTMGRSFGYQNFSFDKDFFDWMIGEVTDFWTKYLIGGDEPPAINVDDILKKYPHQQEGKRISADLELLEKLDELKRVKQSLAEFDERKKALEGDIKMVMGDAEMLCDPKTNFTVATWKKAKDGVKFDDKAFKAEHPDLYNQYLTPKQGARTFLIKKWNEGDILFPA